MLVVSAHWCTKGTFVNIANEQRQIYDYYGFPKHYYEVKYHTKGASDIAQKVHEINLSVQETEDWGLDHGSWPVLMHLFPRANVPVFQMSLDYHATPTYHYAIWKLTEDPTLFILFYSSTSSKVKRQGRRKAQALCLLSISELIELKPIS